MDCRENRNSLNTIIKITVTRNTGKKQETETRYYINSSMNDDRTFNANILSIGAWKTKHTGYLKSFLMKTVSEKNKERDTKLFVYPKDSSEPLEAEQVKGFIG